jgi:hypothetical protein
MRIRIRMAGTVAAAANRAMSGDGHSRSALDGISFAWISVMVDAALVSIKLTPECWRFVHEARSWPAFIPLRDDVQAVLDDIPNMEMSGGVPEPRIVVAMTRPQAEALELWFHALHDDLKYDDALRLTCLLCISRVAVAIMLSEC